jgi:hypothetical protein
MLLLRAQLHGYAPFAYFEVPFLEKSLSTRDIVRKFVSKLDE